MVVGGGEPPDFDARGSGPVRLVRALPAGRLGYRGCRVLRRPGAGYRGIRRPSSWNARGRRSIGAPVFGALALPAEDGRLWPGGKRAGWNPRHDLATGAPLNRAARDGEIRRRLAAGESLAGRGAGAALRPGYRAAGEGGVSNAGTAPAAVGRRPGNPGRGGAVSVAGAATTLRRDSTHP